MVDPVIVVSTSIIKSLIDGDIIKLVLEFVQSPSEVNVIVVAKSSTSTNVPNSRFSLLAVDGVTLPISAVIFKLSPMSSPTDVNVICTIIFF